MDYKYSIIIGCLIITTVSFIAADEEKKKLKLVLDNLDKVNDAEHILKTDISFDKIGEEVKINGQIEQSIDIDDEYKVSIFINL